MVARRIEGKPRRERVRVRPPRAPDPPFSRNLSASEERTPSKSKRKTSKISQTSTRVSPMILMATRNLINMVPRSRVRTSGAVLLTLLAPHSIFENDADSRMTDYEPTHAQLSENADLSSDRACPTQ